MSQNDAPPLLRSPHVSSPPADENIEPAMTDDSCPLVSSCPLPQAAGMPGGSDWTRRQFLRGTTALVSTIPLAGVLASCADDPLPIDATGEPLERIPDALPAPQTQLDITLTVNGETHALRLEPRVTLNSALRDHIGLTGTKLGCDRAACGACTVHVDGAAVLSCSMLAIEAAGKQIETIEGLADGDDLHPLQVAFVENDALQCGFCTPGMIMSCKALLDKNLSPTESDVRTAVAGNLCRCGTYPRVFQAALDAADAMRGG